MKSANKHLLLLVAILAVLSLGIGVYFKPSPSPKTFEQMTTMPTGAPVQRKTATATTTTYYGITFIKDTLNSNTFTSFSQLLKITKGPLDMICSSSEDRKNFWLVRVLLLLLLLFYLLPLLFVTNVLQRL